MTIVRVLSAQEAHARVSALADVLIDCVEGGASVSFMAPLSTEKAQGFWRDMAAGIAARERVLIVAEEAGAILGTVMLVTGQPENQPHRADVSKMLVTRAARKRGLGAALMTAVEAAARAAGKSVLVLDTASADAERLYERSGWERVGVVPDFALNPDGTLCDTTFFFKRLR